MISNLNKIDIEKYGMQELIQLRAQIEKETQQKVSHYNQLRALQQKYEDKRAILSNIRKEKSDLDLLVPLSSSVYVEGTIPRDQKYLIDIGSGYFADMDADQAIKHCEMTFGIIEGKCKESVDQVNQLQQFRDKINRQVHKLYSHDMGRKRVQA